MKKLFAFAIVLMATAIAVAVVSCKKETASTLLNNQPQSSKTFYPEGVDNMNAYLKDFKQKMQTVTRDNEETLSLEEAAWHLSSVANYDFCNVNVEFTDLRYDTLRYHVNVTNGQVALTDLNALYTSVANDIDAFYQSLNLENKHLRFIGASVSNSGNVEISLMTSYRSLDHTWYFSDWFEAGVACDSLFSEDSVYMWQGLAKTELERILNLFESHNCSLNYTGREYYVYTRQHSFYYLDHIDLDGSPFEKDARLCALWGDWGNTYQYLTVDMMCYALDSYAGLGYQYPIDHPYTLNETPVQWIVNSGTEIVEPDNWPTNYHILIVKYAKRYVFEEQGDV